MFYEIYIINGTGFRISRYITATEALNLFNRMAGNRFLASNWSDEDNNRMIMIDHLPYGLTKIQCNLSCNMRETNIFYLHTHV